LNVIAHFTILVKQIGYVIKMTRKIVKEEWYCSF